MPTRTKAQARDPKVDALRRHGCLHPHPEQVTDSLFLTSDFFDARDLVQVKYEMLRHARAQGASISESASAFGLSRPSFYQAQSAFELGGLAGLLPKKRGPRGSHKLSAEVMAYLFQLLSDDPSLRPAELSERVLARFGCKVHPRSVERALARQKKKRA
jgi:transposase